MMLYDSNPRQYSENPISKFNGDKYCLGDPTIYSTFESAKKAAVDRLNAEIQEKQDMLDKLNCINSANECPNGINPFTDIW